MSVDNLRQPDIAMCDTAVALDSPDSFAKLMDATPEQMADLQIFHDLLGVWSGRINLVGPSALGAFWLRHAYDSAQVLHVEQSALRWLDVGAGAGFPGVVLAILLKRRPGAEVHLVESMAKRVGFLREVTARLNLPAEVHHTRAEALASPPGLQIVTARACAPFPRLFGYTSRFFQAGATGLFLKGRDAVSELTEARRDWTFKADLIESRSDPSGRIVRIERLKRRG